MINPLSSGASSESASNAVAVRDNDLEQLRRDYSLFPLQPGLKRRLAEAYVTQARQLHAKRRYEQADEQLVLALELYPEDAGYRLWRGICTYNLKRYDLARYELDQSIRLKGPTAEALYYLGLVLYETGERAQAMDRWEQALRLAPERKEIATVMERSRREMAVEAGMDQGHSSRFDLTYDREVNTEFALKVLDVLETAAGKIGAELGHFPEARVPVAIYRRDDYKRVTHSPDWSGGVYDGTIRIPFGGKNEMTPMLRATLNHEYAHVVVFDLTRGNCPVWLNEGIAEFFGRQQYPPPAGEGGAGRGGGTAMDFKKLEGAFTGFSAHDAVKAYDQSHSLVGYIAARYGWHRITAILRALGDGSPVDQAIGAVLKDYDLSYEGLVQEWREARRPETVK